MITHQARRGGVRAHHLRVADPPIRDGMPVLQRAISPRQPRDRDSGEIRELNRITDVEVKSSRDMIKQSDVNDVRHGPSRPTDFSTVESARRAGSCHAGDSNLRSAEVGARRTTGERPGGAVPNNCPADAALPAVGRGLLPGLLGLNRLPAASGRQTCATSLSRAWRPARSSRAPGTAARSTTRVIIGSSWPVATGVSSSPRVARGRRGRRIRTPRADADLVHRRGEGEWWHGRSFPARWHFDVLRGLDHLRDVGGAADPAAEEAIDLVHRKRRPDGRWPLQNRHPGKTWFELEQVGRPSRWNTLRIARAELVGQRQRGQGLSPVTIGAGGGDVPSRRSRASTRRVGRRIRG